jgi:hypothetical protein
MQRTLKRESKVLEIVKRETIEAFHEEKDTFHGRRERTSLRSGAPRRRPVRDLRRRGVGRAFLFTGRAGGGFSLRTVPQARAHPSPGRVSVGRDGGKRPPGGWREVSALRPYSPGRLPAFVFRPRRSPRKRAPLVGGRLRASPQDALGTLDATASTDPS